MGKEYAGNTREAGSISGLGGPPGDRHPLEKATHSSILAWRTPWTEDPGGLPSMGSHRVGHDCIDLATAAATR